MARTVEDLFKWPVRRDECYYEKQTITIKCYAAVNSSYGKDGCQLVSGTRTLAAESLGPVVLSPFVLCHSAKCTKMYLYIVHF